MSTLIEEITVLWNYEDVLIICDECGEDATPLTGGGLVSWHDPEEDNSILCTKCIEFYDEYIYSIILDWRTIK